VVIIESGHGRDRTHILSTVNSFLSFFFVYIFIVSLGYNAGFFTPSTRLSTRGFIRHRALASLR